MNERVTSSSWMLFNSPGTSGNGVIPRDGDDESEGGATGLLGIA